MRVMLLDVENVGLAPVILEQVTAEDALVVVCYGTNAPKVPLSMVTALAEAMRADRCRFYQVPSAANAADFGLAYHAGKLAAIYKEPVEFIVCSNDKHLDTLVHCLKQDGFDARRSGDAAFMSDTCSDERQIVDYAIRLGKQSNMPKSRKTLRRSAATFLKQHGCSGMTPDDLVAGLERLDFVACPKSGDITYDLDRLSQSSPDTV